MLTPRVYTAGPLRGHEPLNVRPLNTPGFPPPWQRAYWVLHHTFNTRLHMSDTINIQGALPGQGLCVFNRAGDYECIFEGRCDAFRVIPTVGDVFEIWGQFGPVRVLDRYIQYEEAEGVEPIVTLIVAPLVDEGEDGAQLERPGATEYRAWLTAVTRQIKQEDG